MEAARGGFKDIVEELAKRGPNCDLNMRTVSFSPGPFPDFQCCMMHSRNGSAWRQGYQN